MTRINVAIEMNLDESECKVLRDLFNCEDENLGDRLKPYLTAAGHEYVDMFTGNGPITSIGDLRERRLVSIIRHGLRTIPSSALIARLFRIPPTLDRKSVV